LEDARTNVPQFCQGTEEFAEQFDRYVNFLY
jgi:hypothetical protein